MYKTEGYNGSNIGLGLCFLIPLLTAGLTYAVGAQDNGVLAGGVLAEGDVATPVQLVPVFMICLSELGQQSLSSVGGSWDRRSPLPWDSCMGQWCNIYRGSLHLGSDFFVFLSFFGKY